MKTALQEFIETIEERLTIINNETTSLREQMIQTILIDSERYVERERQQIIDSATTAVKSCGMGHVFKELGEQYYNKTYTSLKTLTDSQNNR